MLHLHEYPQVQGFSRAGDHFANPVQPNASRSELVPSMDLGKAQDGGMSRYENTDCQRETSQFLIFVNHPSSAEEGGDFGGLACGAVTGVAGGAGWGAAATGVGGKS